MSSYLIIGSSSGIGKSLTQLLADAGNDVYGTYNSKTGIAEQNFQLHPLNVLDESFTLDFLPDSLEGIVYCPGSINLKPFNRVKPEEYLADFNLQVVGAIKVIQAVLPKLKNAKKSSIVLFSTVAVQMGLSYHSQVSASKGAIEGLTKALAAEFAPNIRVNCIAPSLVDTGLSAALLNTEQKKEANDLRHPLRRIGTVEDIASMAEFLLSEKAGWITGQVMHVDGGMSSLKV
jgi:NAD(P)-dependent dehydrogenase (short-subunit alcohol dehydrogenase family)